MRRLQTRIPEKLFMVFLGMVAIFIFGLLIFRFSLPATAPELLKNTLQELKGRASYLLVIEEYSPGYQLIFKGEILNCNDIKGKLGDHHLEVHRKDGKLYVKPEDETKWQAAEKVQLNSLNSFVTHPAEVIKAVQGDFARFKLVPENGEGYKIHFETVSPDQKFIDRFFPEISPDAVDRLTLEVTVVDPGPVIKQIEIELKLRDSTHGNLTRSYCLD